MSVRIDRGIRITKAVGDEVYKRASSPGGFATHEMPGVLLDACKQVAAEDHVTVPTVVDQLTRQLEMNTEQISDALVDHFTCDDKSKSKLTEAFVYHCCDNDSVANIRQTMSTI